MRTPWRTRSRSWQPRPETSTVVLHCFSAPPERVAEAVANGWFCSFAGNVTYPKAEALREAARLVPDELILVETDAPFLAPQSRRGKPNEPALRGRDGARGCGRSRRRARGARCAGQENAARVLRMVSGRARRRVSLGQNFLADPNLLEAIVREAGLTRRRCGAGGRRRPGDPDRERLARSRAAVHVIEIDERLREGLEGIAARREGVRLVMGDAMKVDFRALDPPPTRDGREPCRTRSRRR